MIVRRLFHKRLIPAGYLHSCDRCGMEFQSTREDRLTCSPSCKQALKRERRRQRQRERGEEVTTDGRPPRRIERPQDGHGSGGQGQTSKRGPFKGLLAAGSRASDSTETRTGARRRQRLTGSSRRRILADLALHRPASTRKRDVTAEAATDRAAATDRRPPTPPDGSHRDAGRPGPPLSASPGEIAATENERASRPRGAVVENESVETESRAPRVSDRGETEKSVPVREPRAPSPFAVPED